MKKEIENPTISRTESFANTQKFAKELKEKFTGIEITNMKVKPVGEISEEIKLNYKGVSLIHIPPRANSLFGFRLWKDNEIYTGRVKTEEEKQKLINEIEIAIDNINNDLAKERQKQAKKEEKAKA